MRNPRRTVMSLLCAGMVATVQQPTSMHSGYVDVEPGVRIHYVESGAPGAPLAILFVPGWSMTAAVWRDQMIRLGSTAHVVAIDPRSQGLSTVMTRGNTPEQRAEDLRRVIQALHLRRTVLVGWSQGVQDVVAYSAAFHGADVAGYVLVDAAVSAGTADSATLRRLALYETHQRDYLEGMMQAIIQSAAGRSRMAEYVRDAMRTPPDIGLSMLVMDFMAVDRRPMLASMNRPTLIIAAASSDELAAQRASASRIPGARLEIVRDAGHAVFLDQPVRFGDLLAGFLRSLHPAD